MRKAKLDIPAIARELLAALDTASLAILPSRRYQGLGFPAAYSVAVESTRLRRARGELPVGRKIGYTNRNIWAQYNMHQPIWGHVFANTVQYAEGNTAVQSLARMVAPRIEPEIAFKLGAPLSAACTDPATVLRSVEWVARTFELVDCHYAGWKFTGADSVIDFAHHAALIVGEPKAIAGRDVAQLADSLRDCRITLLRNGAMADAGVGANALGHPALALAFLADVLNGQPEAEVLESGEIVTTGTLTAALHVERGEIWRTETEGLDLPPLTVHLE